MTLKFQDSGGLQQQIPACLHKGRLNRAVLTDLLSSMKLSLLKVKGVAPNYDKDGYTTQAFQPGEVVELTTIMRPGELWVSVFDGKGASAQRHCPLPTCPTAETTQHAWVGRCI